MRSLEPPVLEQRHQAQAAASAQQFRPADYIDTEEARKRVEQFLGRPTSIKAIRSWLVIGTAKGGVLPSRKVLGRRLIKKADLERYLRLLVGEEVSVP